MEGEVSEMVVGDVAKIVTVEPRTGSPDIRKFDVQSMNAMIDDAMKAIPADKKVAAFARVDLQGAHLTIAGRVPGKIPGELDWTVYVDKPWDGELEGAIGLRWSI